MEVTFDKYYNAQDICEKLYEWVTAEFRCGMSIRINGGTYIELSEYADKSNLLGGFNAADKMINEGRIFYVHPMRCKDKCPVRFRYGGFWACNSCNTHINTPDHWKIKVTQDGNAWCCVGDGFVNLQESNNYAFGDTKQQAIDNYEKIFYTA